MLCSPYNDGNAVFNYIFMLIFFFDSCLSFRVAIIENDILITSSKEIAKNYLRSMIWPSCFPACAVVLQPRWTFSYSPDSCP